MPTPSGRLPPDPRLGDVALTDPDEVGRLLRHTAAAELLGGRVRYLEHDIGRSLLAQHRFPVTGTPREVVVSIGRRSWEAGSSALAARWPLDAGIVRPAAIVEGVTVAWYPFDPGLPLLAEGFAALGVEGPAKRLAWVPQRRAVFACGDVVVKLEAEPQRVDAGSRALELLGGIVRAPSVVRVDRDRAAFVQERLRGRPLRRADAHAVAPAAARLVARVEGAGPWELHGLGVADIVAGLVPVARLVSHAAPTLHDRLHTVVEALTASAPEVELRPAHGDFNIGQLIGLADGSLGIVDADTLCLAPAGFDLAAYATNVMSGRPGDLEAANAVLAELLTGYGPAPDALPWLLAAAALRRLDRPIRRYKRRWPERVERHLADVERFAAAL